MIDMGIGRKVVELEPSLCLMVGAVLLKHYQVTRHYLEAVTVAAVERMTLLGLRDHCTWVEGQFGRGHLLHQFESS